MHYHYCIRICFVFVRETWKILFGFIYAFHKCDTNKMLLRLSRNREDMYHRVVTICGSRLRKAKKEYHHERHILNMMNTHENYIYKKRSVVQMIQENRNAMKNAVKDTEKNATKSEKRGTNNRACRKREKLVCFCLSYMLCFTCLMSPLLKMKHAFQLIRMNTENEKKTAQKEKTKHQILYNV